MDNLIDCLFKENPVYLTKLRLEIKSLQLLTNKIFSEVHNKKDHQMLKENPNMSRMIVTNSAKVIATEDLYENVNKFLLALIQYFDSRENHFNLTLPTVISGPKFCHLSTLCNMLWKRIEIMNKPSHAKSNVTATNLSKESEKSSAFKSSQTDMSSLTFCESCHLSTELIKSMVYFILEQQRIYDVEETNVSNFRERIRNEVFDMSQWGSMKEWTTAILQDTKWLLSLTVSSFKKCDRLHQEQEAMRQEHNRNEIILQNDLDLVRTQLEAERAQSTYLKQQIENLNVSLARRIKQEKTLLKNMNKYHDKFKFIGESLKFIKDDCQQMRASQKSLKTFIRSIFVFNLRTILDLKHEILCVVKKLEDYFIEALQKEKITLNTILTSLQEKENLVSNLKTDILELRNEKEQLNEKMKVLEYQKNAKEDEIRKITEKVMELEKIFQETKVREHHSESQTQSSSEENLKISGDPMTDMENQRQINKQKIRVLLRENANLKTTISKLKKIKTELFQSTSSKFA